MTEYTCSLCNRVTSLDHACKYIISVVQTGGEGRCSYARTLVVCQHCAKTHKTIMNLQRKSTEEPNILEFHTPTRTRRAKTRTGAR